MRNIISRPTMLIALVFVISRCVYGYYFNVQFDLAPLNYNQQYLDPYLLRHDLLRSIFYLHQQPPLFNLYLGAILKLFPEYYAIAFKVIYLFIGLAFSLCLFRLMEVLHVRHSIAITLVTIFMISPTTVMYENWLHYAYPVACMLCASALFLNRFLKTGGKFDGLLFFSIYVALVLTRGLFRPELFVLTIIILWCCCKDKRKAILQTASAPLLLLILFCAKQYILFDTISAGSSYVGRNLSMRVKQQIPEETRNVLIQNKVVTEFFFLPPHKPISYYRKYLPPMDKTGVPALDRERKTTRAVNFNHIGYLAQSDAYVADFKSLLFAYPEYYLHSFKKVGRYFYPAGDHRGVKKRNYKGKFKKISKYYDTVVLGKFAGSPYAWWLVIALPIVLIFGTLRSIRLYRKEPDDTAQWLVSTFIVLHIIFLTLLTTAVSTGDYNRYRFEFNSFYLVLFALLCQQLLSFGTKGYMAMGMMLIKNPKDRMR